MSVLIDTSLGDLVIDLYHKECPKACLNFIKLCKMKYFNNCLFYDVQKDYITQTGDPANTGKNPTSLFGILDGEKNKFFEDEINPKLRHNKKGTVSTANLGPNLNTSSFFISLSNNNNHNLNGMHTLFGQVEEGLEVLDKINSAYTDKEGRPYQNIRIKHTIVLEDPFDDPEGLIIPSNSPEPVKDTLEYNRLEDDFQVNEYFKDKETETKVQEKLAEHEAKNRALVLEMLDDIPDADIKPPENVLFVCRLNPITQDDDLELIFSRFGPVKSCQIIRDWKTGESLQYAFVEFETVEACEEAYFKMDGVVIDERRIHVDFSQSVSKLWQNFHSGNKEGLELEHDEKKSKELILPNESKKFEIKNTKDFLIDKRRYKMVFDNDEQDCSTNNQSVKKERKSGKDKDRVRSRARSRSRSRSRSEKKHKIKKSKHSRSRSRSKEKNRTKEHYTSRYKSRSRSYEKDHHHNHSRHESRSKHESRNEPRYERKDDYKHRHHEGKRKY